jgi:aminoglycoside phosphotransferase (APT) family kinase protein
VTSVLRDEARVVRDEDAFDVAAVHRWLGRQVEGLGSDLPEVRQFAGGASNLTYLLAYPDRELILRRPPAGEKAASAHDMQREHRMQSLLRPVYPYVPEMVAFCGDIDVIGSEFYVMERLDGIILRTHLPRELDLDEQQVRTLCTSVVDRLIDLHTIDPYAAGLSALGKGAGYVERQITGWTARYRAAKTWNVPSFEKVMAWLEANRPDDVATRVIHNDFRFDNVVLDPADPTRVVGVLDWELATLGDPLMDLGASLAYWVQADDGRLFSAFRRQPTHVPGMLTRAEVIDRYAQRTGFPIADWRFYEVYGLFRLAVIAQQIYRRYARKETRNPAFRHFWLASHVLDRRCRRIIASAPGGRG